MGKGKHMTGKYRIEFLRDDKPLEIAPATLMEENARLRALNAELVGALAEIETWTVAATHVKVGQPDNFGGEARVVNAIARAVLAKAREESA